MILITAKVSGLLPDNYDAYTYARIFARRLLHYFNKFRQRFARGSQLKWKTGTLETNVLNFDDYKYICKRFAFPFNFSSLFHDYARASLGTH